MPTTRWKTPANTSFGYVCYFVREDIYKMPNFLRCVHIHELFFLLYSQFQYTFSANTTKRTQWLRMRTYFNFNSKKKKNEHTRTAFYENVKEEIIIWFAINLSVDNHWYNKQFNDYFTRFTLFFTLQSYRAYFGVRTYCLLFIQCFN